MKKMVIVLAAILISILVAVAGLRVWREFASLFSCDVNIIDTIASPGNALVAIVYEVNCDATTPFNTQVSITPNGKPFTPDRFPPFLVVRGQYLLKPKWEGERRIVVHVPNNEEIYHKQAKDSGVSIIYE